MKASDALNRIFTVHLSHFECYCICLLLTRVMGSTSLQALKIVSGHKKAVFREARIVLGLLEDDNHWNNTLEDAVLCRSAAKVRELFAIMLSTCGFSNAMKLREKYKIHLSEDIAHRYQSTAFASDDTIYFNEALKLIEEKVFSMVGKQLADFGKPTPQHMGQLSTI